MASIRWNGAKVMAKVTAAAGLGIDRTMAECVRDAGENHPAFPPPSKPYERYANRTGHETGSIHSKGVRTDGKRVSGQWGANAKQSLYLEIGTSVAGPTAFEREVAGGGNMDAIPPPVGPLMAPRPYLRPAADREYPLLPSRIGAAYRGEKMP